jgi:hypothetical protein
MLLSSLFVPLWCLAFPCKDGYHKKRDALSERRCLLLCVDVFVFLQEQKYLDRFATMALDAKTWCASEESAEFLIQEALIDVRRPQYRMPQREFARANSSPK